MQRRLFSAITEDASRPSRRISLTLYRQLLRWCKATDPALPLASFVPPVHLCAPEQVDPFRMEVLSQTSGDIDDMAVRRARHLLPDKTYLKRSSMTVPIASALDLHHFFQAIFRLNSGATSASVHRKQQISVAFEALKSLNEMTGGIQSLLLRRKRHELRDNVAFHVGQVVQHQDERWRGVVVGWERSDNSDDASFKPTSLTTKTYVDPALTQTSREASVRYDVVVDEGDSHLMGFSSERTSAMQTELALVDDECLIRIRSRAIADFFVRFDPERATFIPNALLGFEYPCDIPSQFSRDARFLSQEDRLLCTAVVDACQDIARTLERFIIDETSCPMDRGLELLSNVQDRLRSLLDGDVLPMSFEFSSVEPAPSTVAAHHLRSLLMISVEVMDVMFHRQYSKDHKSRKQFSLGDIVRHKVYGFRGVVVAWDPKPTFDVSRWDGVQHIENPVEHPFYHVIPDRRDCLRAFGAERPFRYVCEANLELCPKNQNLLEVDLDWDRSPRGDRYIPSKAASFQYAGDEDDDDEVRVTERCMAKIQDFLNRWQYESLQPSTQSPLSAQNLLKLLQVVDNGADASAVQELIKEMRKAHPDLGKRMQLERGLAELMSGNGEKALDIYSEIVNDDETSYPEAFNKIATCQFMMGRIEDSLESTMRTLSLDPSHVQALNGLGLIHFESGRYLPAIESFRKSIRLDPWSPVTAKLSVSIDLVNHTMPTDEIGGEVR